MGEWWSEEAVGEGIKDPKKCSTHLLRGVGVDVLVPREQSGGVEEGQ